MIMAHLRLSELAEACGVTFTQLQRQSRLSRR